MSYKVVLFCGPRGAGKGTLVAAALTSFPILRKIISHTTRQPREGEKDGDQYRYVTREAFDQLVSERKFIHWQRISETQRSGVTVSEALGHLHGVTDVTPAIGQKIRRLLGKHNGQALLVGVYAPRRDRLSRIVAREPHLSDEAAQTMVQTDPVTLQEMSKCDVVISNHVSGDPAPAIAQMRRVVAKFLNEG